jgi:menaquinone reductase, molybdopterin-binding-like subunit
MTIGRRDFLRFVPAAAAAAGCAPLLACNFPLHAGTPPTLGVTPPRGAPEKWVVSTCGACPGGCGIRARLVAGRLVGITGNPLHPVNRGGLCPLGLAGAHAVYHPDRIRGPLLRSGDGAGGELRAATWDEALSTLSARLRDLRQRGESHTVALVDGTRGLSREVAARFLSTYGSPNHLDGRAWSDLTATEAVRAMQGVEAPSAYDVENARFVLAFGSGWLEGAWSPVGAARAYGIARRGRKSGRVHVVHVEPRLSVSAARADEWIPIAPGTEGVFALGLVHMVLREGLESRESIDRRGAGFEALRAIVLRDHHPDAVSEVTGVPVATLIRVARQFASTRPALAIGDDRNGPGVHTLQTRMAIHALNAVVGSINAPGGVLTPPGVPLDPLPAAEADERGARGRSAAPIVAAGHTGSGLAALQGWIEGAGSYPVNLLVAYGSDPLAALGGSERARAALRKVPFVVSFSPFLDDTARMADLVLPNHTYLERWQDDPTFTSRGFPVLGLRQPVLEPRHDTRDAVEVLAETGRRVGGPVAAALPWSAFPEVIRLSARGLHRSGRGALFDVPEAEAWIVTMETAGWRASNFGSFDEFWTGLTKRGGWWDPVYDFGERSRVLRTPSGKLEFGPLVRAIEASPRVEATGQAAPAAVDRASHPLRLHLYPLLAAFGDTQGPLPFVQDVLGRELQQSWTLWVELAPPDAMALGLEDGARVKVESEDGVVEARVKVFPGIRPGVAAMPMGPGGSPGETSRRAMAQQAGMLVGLRKGPAGTPSAFGDTWVRVRRA